MTKGIAAAISAVQTVMLTLPGIRYAPIDPPDSIAQAEPVAICMAGRGQVNYSSGLLIYNPITLLLWITVTHKDTPRDSAKLIDYGDDVPAALWTSLDLAGAVDTIEAVRIAGYGPWVVNSMDRFGWAFEIDVRITAC